MTRRPLPTKDKRSNQNRKVSNFDDDQQYTYYRSFSNPGWAQKWSSPTEPSRTSFFCNQVFFDYVPSSATSLLFSADITTKNSNEVENKRQDTSNRPCITVNHVLDRAEIWKKFSDKRSLLHPASSTLNFKHGFNYYLDGLPSIQVKTATNASKQ